MRVTPECGLKPLRGVIRGAALSGISLLGLISSPQAQQASARLEELSVQGQGGGASTAPLAVREDPRGPIDGFVAKRTLPATKTDTPLIETPQSVSVIGRQQIDAIKPQQIGEIINYSPGVYGNAFGPDARFDFFQIRGFTASDTGL